MINLPQSPGTGNLKKIKYFYLLILKYHTFKIKITLIEKKDELVLFTYRAFRTRRSHFIAVVIQAERETTKLNNRKTRVISQRVFFDPSLRGGRPVFNLPTGYIQPVGRTIFKNLKLKLLLLFTDGVQVIPFNRYISFGLNKKKISKHFRRRAFKNEIKTRTEIRYE